MNFQNLKKIEKPDVYIDIAFKRAKKLADETRYNKEKGLLRIEKSKLIEVARLDSVQDTLNTHLTIIIESFPSLDDLAEFYKELIKSMLDYAEIKKSLGAVNWARSKISFFHEKFRTFIQRTRHIESINQFRQEYYGRVSSVIKQISHNLEFLETARLAMKGFPSIKTSVKTVCIFGFPNVGKTTLLYKLTGSKPEIADYPFTTKNINIGYMLKGRDQVQILDTPGTLNRFNKMNPIEQQAHLALKYLAEDIIYVFDLTEEYPLADQIELLESVKEFHKPVMIYLSKTDILDKKIVSDFKKKFETVTFEELKENIIGKQ